jgi:hypothetical protein
LAELTDVKFNARERIGDKRRAFVCRLTSGSFAIVYDGKADDVRTMLINNLNDVKREVALLVPDQRIPIYDETEMALVRHELAAASQIQSV